VKLSVTPILLTNISENFIGSPEFMYGARYECRQSMSGCMLQLEPRYCAGVKGPLRAKTIATTIAISIIAHEYTLNISTAD
jgi:hypothetical protein